MKSVGNTEETKSDTDFFALLFFHGHLSRSRYNSIVYQCFPHHFISIIVATGMYTIVKVLLLLFVGMLDFQKLVHIL